MWGILFLCSSNYSKNIRRYACVGAAFPHVAATTGVAGAQTKSATKAAAWKTYRNARYGYALPYPATLYPKGESDNGDGQVFASRDTRVKPTVFASYNALDETLDSRYDRDKRGALADDPNRMVTYRARKKTGTWSAAQKTAPSFTRKPISSATFFRRGKSRISWERAIFGTRQ